MDLKASRFLSENPEFRLSKNTVKGMIKAPFQGPTFRAG